MSLDAPLDRAPEVAVILLTKNSQRYLDEILAAIHAQATARAYEVLAVDSGSQDDTLNILRGYGVRITQIPPAEFNHGETRNLGARQASSSVRYLVYLTHDATPQAGWLDGLVDAVEAAPRIAGAFSRHLPRPTCPLPMARLLAEEWEQSGTPDRVVKKLTDPEDYERRRAWYAWFSNTSSCLRREVWEAHPFARVDFAEDAEWADRVLRAGFTLVYEPKSCVVHSHDYGLADQFAQNMDHARGMHRIFPFDYAQLPPLRARLFSFLRTLGRDARFIWRRPQPVWRRVFWLAYSPLWHLASHLGTLAGRHAERLPAWLTRRISKQERLRALGGADLGAPDVSTRSRVDR
jgi:rhamnosyltransferase